MLGQSNHTPRINIGPPNFRCQILVPLPICFQLTRHSSEEMMKNAWGMRVPWMPNFGTKKIHAERQNMQPKCRVDIKSCGGMTCCFSVLSSSTKVFLLIGRALANKNTEPKRSLSRNYFQAFQSTKNLPRSSNFKPE